MNYSKSWFSSAQARKQRNARENAPPHVKAKLMGARTDKELRKTAKKRTVGVRRGDEVKIVRGQFKNMKGIVEKADIKEGKIYVKGAATKKTDGSERMRPIDPSNVIITKLALEDKQRAKKYGG